MRDFTLQASRKTSNPSIATWPLVGFCNVSMISRVVVFPAPLGPRIPKTSPRATVNEMPSTATTEPKCFTRFSTRMIGSLTSEVERGTTVGWSFELCAHVIFLAESWLSGETARDCDKKAEATVAPAVLR